MKKLNHILRWDNFDLLGIALFLTVLSLFTPYVFLVFLLFIVYARKYLPWLLYLIIVILWFMGWIWINEEIDVGTVHQEGVLVDKESFETHDRWTIEVDHRKYHVNISSGLLQIGQKIVFKGKIHRYENATVPHGFDTYTYYRSKGIEGYIQFDTYEIIAQHTVFYSLRDRLVTSYRQKEVSPHVLNTLFGERIDQEIKAIYDSLGITFLLSISGLHLYVIAQSIKKGLYFLSISDKKQDLIVFMCYLGLTYLHRFDIGISRLMIMQGLLLLNQHFSWRRSRLELLQITFIIMVMTNLSLLFSQGLCISYLIINIIYLTKSQFNRFDGYVKRMVFSGFLMIWLIPFYQSVNLVIIIFMPFFITLIVYGYTIGSLFVWLYTPLNHLLVTYANWVDRLLYLTNQHSISLTIPQMNAPIIVSYYMLIIFFFLAKKNINKAWILCVTMGLITFSSALSLNQNKLLFLDVGQGDSTIIETKQCVAVVDSYRNVYDYLKDQGRSKIDYLFLTHSDIDHIKEADFIIENFNVSHLIGSAEVDYPIFQMPMTKASAGHIFPCGDIHFKILGPLRTYQDENSASLVIQFDFFNERILLTGDIDKEAEMDLVNRYKYELKSDVLKIAHHGSNSSSSSLFLNYVNPKVAIISLGRDNRYQFPHDDVIDRLNVHDISIYRTDQQGTIVFDPNRKGGKWYFHLPFSPRFWYNMYGVRGRMYG